MIMCAALTTRFKLHGSVNWGNPVVEDARLDPRQPIERVRDSIIELSDSIHYEQEVFAVLNEPRIVVNKFVNIPAISIPVQTKSHFSCPRDWLPYLETLLDGISNLLVIGWRGGEEHFLKRAVPVLNKNGALNLSIVSHTETSAKETQARLETASLKPARVWIYSGGFTNFIVSDDVKIFLRRGGDVV